MRVFGLLVILNVGICSLGFKLLHKAKINKQPLGFGTAKHAVIIGIDGFGGEYLRNFTDQLPALQTFFDYGAYSTRTRNLSPTISAPNWAGFLTSMGVTQSGVFTNYWVVADGNPSGKAAHLPPTSGRGLPQTMFSVLKEQDPSAKTALIFSWNWFKNVAIKNPHVDYWFAGDMGITCSKTESHTDCANKLDWNMQERIYESIKKDQPTLLFIHLDAVDSAGHNSHWGSELYYEMVKQKDKQVAGILEILETTKTSSGKPMIEDTIVVATADHGGYRSSHDITPPMICEVHIPLLLKGPGIRNIDIDDYDFRDVSSLDMTVTVLNALGVKPGKYMRGRVLEEIYADTK